jgi:ribosomal protein S18 acetylase RimI-like enzyme
LLKEGKEDLHVIKGSGAHAEACMGIARQLRTHFNEEAMVQMPKDLMEHEIYIGQDDDGDVVGFLTIRRRSTDVGDISWMGVRPDMMRRGIGTAMVARATEDLVSDGATIMMVHTLADTVEYEPYEATRAFYRSVGFKHLETVDPFPGVAPGNPIAIYVRPL